MKKLWNFVKLEVNFRNFGRKDYSRAVQMVFKFVFVISRVAPNVGLEGSTLFCHSKDTTSCLKYDLLNNMI